MSAQKRTTSTISIGGNFRNGTLPSERGREERARPMTPEKAQITLAHRLTPELASRMDLDAVYLAGVRYAGRCLRRQPRHAVRELVHDGWIQLSTTKQWDPTKLPLERWFLLVLRNLINVVYKQDGEDLDAETAAQQRNYEERERFTETMPADDVLVEREERAERVRLARWHAAQVEGVEAAVQHNPVAAAVLREWRSAGCDLKPRQLADRLGLSVYQIYKAKEVIQYQAKRIRNAMENEGATS
jgi:hypothetical protein